MSSSRTGPTSSIVNRRILNCYSFLCSLDSDVDSRHLRNQLNAITMIPFVYGAVPSFLLTASIGIAMHDGKQSEPQSDLLAAYFSSLIMRSLNRTSIELATDLF